MRYFGSFKSDRLRYASRACMQSNAVALATPMDLQKEKEKWIKKVTEWGVFDLPEVRYNSVRLSNMNRYFDNHENLLEGILPESSVDEVILTMAKSRLDDAIVNNSELAVGILTGDTKMARNAVLRKYGRPNSELVKMAKKMYQGARIEGEQGSRFSAEEQKALKSMKFEADEIRFCFERIMNEIYEFEDWEIRITPWVSSVVVKDDNHLGKSYIDIPKIRRIDGLKLLELIGHKIECHMRGSENCRELLRELIDEKDPMRSFILPIVKNDNRVLGEGCAKLSDINISGYEAIPEPGYVLAISAALDGKSFAEIGEMIYDLEVGRGKTPEQAAEMAWMVTCMALRGLADMRNSDGYAFTKGYIYLEGLLLAKKLKGTAREVYFDYGSITLDELEKVGVKLKPKHRNLDAVSIIAKELLEKAA